MIILLLYRKFSAENNQRVGVEEKKEKNELNTSTDDTYTSVDTQTPSTTTSSTCIDVKHGISSLAQYSSSSDDDS